MAEVGDMTEVEDTTEMEDTTGVEVMTNDVRKGRGALLQCRLHEGKKWS